MNRDIYGKIKNRILFLEYAPGQILNEKVLADEFGVSRTPLREVLIRLEWDQLVRILPRTGSMVSEIEFPKMMNTYQIRFEIEDLLGRLSTPNVTEEHMARLAALETKCAALYENKDTRALVQIDLTFRDLLFSSANNPVLETISNYLYNLTLRLWIITLPRGAWAVEVEAMHHEIQETLKAWVEKNPNKTGAKRREALVGHFERIRDKYFGMTASPND
ncbi:MAG: GntR family transcriptional regulator [Thermodesulfobacteriota bacterium]